LITLLTECCLSLNMVGSFYDIIGKPRMYYFEETLSIIVPIDTIPRQVNGLIQVD
jgi:hypothetical protein